MKDSFDIPAKKISRKQLEYFIRRNLLKKRSPKDIKILSLVGPEAIDVFDIYDPLKIPRENIVACEMNRENAKILKLRDLGITVVEDNVVNYLKNTDRTFNVMNLDFCGCLNSKVVDAVKYIFGKRILRNNGLLACTFLARRENAEIRQILKEPFASIKMSKDLLMTIKNKKLPRGEILKMFEQDLPLEKYIDISKNINRLGIPLKIIHHALLGNAPINDGVLAMLFYNNPNIINIRRARKTIEKLENPLTRRKNKNKNPVINGKFLSEIVDEQKRKFESTLSSYTACDGNFLAWRGYVPTDMDFYRYLSDKGSPMINLYFKFEFVENLYKTTDFDRWYQLIYEIYIGKAMPKLQYIETPPSPQISIAIDKKPPKIDEDTKNKIILALKQGITKDKIANIFKVTKMQVSAIDAWITMGKY